MLFLFFNNADIKFEEKKLIQKIYNINEALPIIKQMWLIKRKKFAVATLDLDKNTSVINIPYLKTIMLIYQV